MINRSTTIGMALGGLILLTVSATFPWVEVPMTSKGSAGSVALIEPSVTLFYKLGCQIIVIVGFLMIEKRILRGGWIATLSAFWLVSLLLYPYFVTVWHPRLSAEAAWLQLQHENLTGASGDIATGSEFTSAALKDPIYLVNTPNRVAILRLPQSYPSEFQLENAADLCDWLGYTEAFCQFSRLGWYLALLGTMSILISSCIAGGSDRKCIAHVVRLVLFLGVAAAAVAWTLPFVAGWHVRSAETLVRQGQYAEALAEIDRAQSTLPILRYDSYLIAQRGQLLQLTGKTDRLAAKLRKAVAFERDGRYAEANSIYRAIVRDTTPASPYRREACRGLLRDAIHAFNSGSIDIAINELNEVLEAEPTNIKAMYALQLACVRSGRNDDVANLADRLELVYGCFQHPLKDSVRSASQHNKFVSALDLDNLTAAINAYQKSQSP